MTDTKQTSAKNTIWGIKCSRGIDTSTVSYCRSSAIRKFLEDRPLMPNWKQAYKDGFRAVKLQEVKYYDEHEEGFDTGEAITVIPCGRTYASKFRKGNK